MAVLFTEKFVKNIYEAWDSNRDEVGDVYYHPTENGILKKCIDLSCHKPLTKVHTFENKPESSSSEKWLEAYIIQLAKRRDNYKKPFKLVDKEHNLVDQVELNCCFLYSQLKFRQTEESKARPLDCLLYEPATHHLIILELKTTREERNKAIAELDHYAKKVYENKDELAKIFHCSGGVIAVEGYVAWPGNDKFNNKTPLDFGKWGLIGYSDPHGMIKNGKLVKPWEQFKDFKKKLTIDFTIFKRSKRYQI